MFPVLSTSLTSNAKRRLVFVVTIFKDVVIIIKRKTQTSIVGKHINHKGRNRRFTNPEELEEERRKEEQKKKWRQAHGESSSDEEEASGDQKGSEEDSEEESSSDDEVCY